MNVIALFFDFQIVNVPFAPLLEECNLLWLSQGVAGKNLP